MTHETESGFGSGLRALIDRKAAEEEQLDVAEEELEPIAATPPPVLDVMSLQTELEAALGRERDLRAALEQQVASYERERSEDQNLALRIAELEQARNEPPPELEQLREELEAAHEREQKLQQTLEAQRQEQDRDRAEGNDLAVRAAELEQQVAELAQLRSDIEEQQVVLKIQRDQFEAERGELAEMRATIVAEEARVTELASHIDSRSVQLESADQERAQAGAHLAQQLAGLAERERELKRERAAIEQVREEQEARFLARENALRELDGSTLKRQQSIAQREVALKGASAELERERGRVQELADGLSQREATLTKKLEARERMLTNGEGALAAWEARLREQSERLERERSGHGHASQEAFALLAELEQREARLGERETRLLDAEDGLAARSVELTKAMEEIRVREARLFADVELREDKLEARERNIAEREELIEFRERDVREYVGQIQGVLGETRDVA
jgi:DNA repair exonuclease SbcCD ATPase subunit